MYDSNGCPIIGFQDRDMREVFGTLDPKNRKNHHKLYLDKLDKERLIPLVASVWCNDPLYNQYMKLISAPSAKDMRGRILLTLVRASLLYFQYPSRIHFNYEGLMKIQILALRRTMYKHIKWYIHNNNLDCEAIKIVVPKPKLKMMSERLANILEQPVFELRPMFLEAIEIDNGTRIYEPYRSSALRKRDANGRFTK